jgi:subtilase family serine protease
MFMRSAHRFSMLSILAISFGILVALYLPLRHVRAQSSRPILITERIDETRLVTLGGNTRPEATAQNDRGRVPDDFPMEHMFLQLKRPPELEQALRQFMDEQQDKKSPNFRHWLMPAELGQKYGVADSDIETIKSWLESHGFTVGYVYPNRMLMDISGTAGQIREAFHTELHYLDVNGEQHFANMSDPRIPAALAPAIVGIVQLHNFKPHPMLKRRTEYNLGGGDYGLVPADYQTIYNLTPLYRAGIYGQGQTIVVVEDTNSYGSDWSTYQTTFGLNKYGGTLTTVHPNIAGNCTNPGTNADDGEADIDVEVAAAIAPGATIELASCSDGTLNAYFGGLIAIENLVSAGNPPTIISMSYGECEARNGATSNAAFNSAFQTAAAAGVSVFVSSGDEAADSCSPNATSATTGIGVTGWGETAYNVSVGGTDFEDAYNAAKPANDGLAQSTYWSSSNGSTYGDALSYIPEIPWNDSCAGYLVYNLAGAASGNAYCQSLATGNGELTTGAGSGGPSGCATGAPSTTGVVSGTCAGYAKPSWQSGIVGNPADGVRDIPDVSMFASNGIWGHYVIICWSDPTQSASGSTPCTGAPSTWAGFGGTSISSPTMASIQALVNQKWKLTSGAGNPNPTYYSIANSEFGAGGNPNCYSINQQQPRRGQQSACTFFDVTQGDIVVNTSGTHVNSYLPSGSRGSMSTQPLTGATVLAGGVGYTSNPTCAFAAPSNLNQYLSPQNTVLWAGGTQATCTATFNAGTLTEVGTIAVGATVATTWAGATVTVGSTTYTFVVGAPTAVNQVELYTGSTSTTNRTDTAADLEAVINGNSAQCPAVTGTGCVFSGQTPNASVTATVSTSTVTVTAKTVGSAGNFALSANNNFASNITTAYTTVGAGPGYVNAISLVNAGQGYNGSAGCTLSGGGGSGAICVGIEAATTLAPTLQQAYGATPGWDFATGIGTPNAYNLVMNKAW